MKEVLEDINFSLSLFKEERKEKLRREKEALSLLKALVKRAKKERVTISLSLCPKGDDLSLSLVVNAKEGVATKRGDEPFSFISFKKELTKGGFEGERERVFSILYSAMKSGSVVRVEEAEEEER